MKITAIYLSLAVILPAVLALPQPKESILDRLMGKEMKNGKVAGDVAVSTVHSSTFKYMFARSAFGAWNLCRLILRSLHALQVTDPGAAIPCPDHADCGAGSLCVAPTGCLNEFDVLCKKECTASGIQRNFPVPILR